MKEGSFSQINGETQQSYKEEVFNGISHCVAVLASIAGLVILIILASGHNLQWSLFSCIIYGISLIFLYSASSIYHFVTKPILKSKLRIIDHAGIYILIAGTYTPFSLLVIGGYWGWLFFVMQWGIAFLGIIFKIYYTGKYESFSIVLYLFMGWMVIFKIEKSITYSL